MTTNKFTECLFRLTIVDKNLAIDLGISEGLWERCFEIFINNWNIAKEHVSSHFEWTYIRDQVFTSTITDFTRCDNITNIIKGCLPECKTCESTLCNKLKCDCGAEKQYCYDDHCTSCTRCKKCSIPRAKAYEFNRNLGLCNLCLPKQTNYFYIHHRLYGDEDLSDRFRCGFRDSIHDMPCSAFVNDNDILCPTHLKRL